MSQRLPRIRVAGMATRGREILLVEHERDGRRYSLLPGGGLEWGETCAQGLAREFMEELSLRVKVGKLLIVNESIAPGGRRHILNLTFRVQVLGGRLRVARDRRLKAGRWVDRAGFQRSIFYPAIRPQLLRAWKQGFKSGVELTPTPWR